MESVWSECRESRNVQRLNGDISTDVLIIGAGMAGMLCGYLLKEKGVDCVIVDGGKLFGGVSENTTAKITAQHSLIYDKLISTFGIEKAEKYLAINQEAVKKYIILGESIACDMELQNSYVYSKDRCKIEKEINALKRIGYKAITTDKIPFNVQAASAVGFVEQAQFNPIKFANGITKNLCIYENTFVKEIDKRRAITDHGVIRAAKIIIATHFPFLNRCGMYFMKMYQQRSYVLAIKSDIKIEGMYVDEADYGMSFRHYKDMLLIGGGGHKTGEYGGGWRELEEYARKNFPDCDVRYRWAAQDCMTLDSVPYIGEYGKNTAGLYVATGFNKWGMTSSMVSAMILSDMAVGKENEYEDVFSPNRSILHPQLLKNIASTTKNILTLKTPRCSHLGCRLKWNKQERSWDCPCHGSRYDGSGKVLDNPAMKNIDV